MMRRMMLSAKRALSLSCDEASTERNPGVSRSALQRLPSRPAATMPWQRAARPESNRVVGCWERGRGGFWVCWWLRWCCRGSAGKTTDGRNALSKAPVLAPVVLVASVPVALRRVLDVSSQFSEPEYRLRHHRPAGRGRRLSYGRWSGNTLMRAPEGLLTRSVHSYMSR